MVYREINTAPCVCYYASKLIAEMCENEKSLTHRVVWNKTMLLQETNQLQCGVMEIISLIPLQFFNLRH